MVSKQAWVVALVFGLFFIPAVSGQQTTVCTTWFATVCGDETYNTTTWHEGIFVFVPENKANGKQAATLDDVTVDISVSAFTNAGDQAFVGVLDVQKKDFSGLPGTGVEGYLIAGQAKGGSNASISADVTHHSNTPHSVTEQICMPVQLGTMPPPGDYKNKLIGHVSLALPPQHGGTVANTGFSIFSPSAKGTFAVDASGM